MYKQQSTWDDQRSYVVAIMAEVQSVCIWNALTLTNKTSSGFSTRPSYANSAYGFNLQMSHGCTYHWLCTLRFVQD